MMDANDVQIFVCKLVRIWGRSCLCCVKKYPFHSLIMLLLFLLYMFLPLVFIVLLYSIPVVGFAFLVHRVFAGIDPPKARSVGTKRKRWKELKSRRSFRSLNRVRVPNRNNEGSSMHDPPVVRRNVKEKGKVFYTNTCAKDKDVVFSTIFNDALVDKRALVEENPKEIREVTVKSVHGGAGFSSSDASQPLMPVRRYGSDRVDKNLKEIREVTVESVRDREDISSSIAAQHLMPVSRYMSGEGCREDGFDHGNSKVETREILDTCEDEEERHGHRNKAVRRIEEDEKSLMDLGISEVERTKRLESLIARRRSRKLLSFPGRRIGTGAGVGNNSCGQISSLHIPKMNPFLADGLGSLSPVPGSAPSYLVPRSPFDIPYDPHEEKPILTGDSFHEEFMATHQKEPMFCRHESFNVAKFIPPEPTHDKHETSTVANMEDDEEKPQQDGSFSLDAIDDNPAGEGSESSEIVVDVVHFPNEDVKKEGDGHHDASSDQSCSSSSSSEDEPILRPNREAILHCLSMSRMRVASNREEYNFPRHESFDCGPSALFDRAKADCFFFGANKRVHHTSTNSIASDLQVEVSELGSPPLTNISSLDEEVSVHDEDMVVKGKESLLNSINQSETDANEAQTRDVDEVIEHGATEAELSRRDDYLGPHELIMKPENPDEQDDREMAQNKDAVHTLTSTVNNLDFEKPDYDREDDLDFEKPDYDREDVQRALQIETQSHLPVVGRSDRVSLRGSSTTSSSSSPKLILPNDIETLDQGREGHVLETEAKSSVHPPPLVGQANTTNIRVSPPSSSSSSSSPQFVSQTEALIGQSSSSNHGIDNKAQVLNTEMEEASRSYDHIAPDRLTEAATEEAPIPSTVLQPELSTNQAAASSNFAHEEVNEARQSDDRTSATDSSNQLLPDSLPPAENNSPPDTSVAGVTPMLDESTGARTATTVGTENHSL